MYKGKIDKLINEINKIARLKRISYKLENIYEEYDEFIEDYYFMEWIRISQDGITQVEELNNMLELFEQILEEIEIVIYLLHISNSFFTVLAVLIVMLSFISVFAVFNHQFAFLYLFKSNDQNT